MAAPYTDFVISPDRRTEILAAVALAEMELARLRSELADAKTWHRWFVTGAEGLAPPALELGSIASMAWRCGSLSRARAIAEAKATKRGPR